MSIKFIKQLMKNLLRVLFLLTISTLSVKANIENLKSYKTNFTQTIIDQDGVKIVYTGIFMALKPIRAVWHYKKPIQKSVYVNSRQVVIVEPELEQAIYKEVKESFTLFNILKDATKIDDQTFRKKINNRIYRLKIIQNKLISLHYKDDFENKVSFVFSNQQPNITLKAKLFHPIILENYDIINEQQIP